MLPRFILAFCLTSFALTLEVDAHQQKEPLVAFGLSVLIPGAGQIYNGQYITKGMIHTGTFLYGMRLIEEAEEDDYKDRSGRTVDSDDDNWMEGLGLLLHVGSRALSSLDAFFSAERINQKSQKSETVGHLLEFDGDRGTLGIDLGVLRNWTGARLTLHF